MNNYHEWYSIDKITGKETIIENKVPYTINEINMNSNIVSTINISDNTKLKTILLNNKWYIGKLIMNDLNKTKSYYIYYQNYKDQLYIRPLLKYYCMVFEEFFGFQYKCHGFDINKIIHLITKDT